jgi:hypothetical protein
MWRWAMLGSLRFKTIGGLARLALRTTNRLGLAGTLLDPARPWTKDRASLRVPAKPFRTLWKEHCDRN